MQKDEILALLDISPDQSESIHWTPQRKARLSLLIEKDKVSIETAQVLFGLSIEELISWRDRLRTQGIRGLRITHTQTYRNMDRLIPEKGGILDVPDFHMNLLSSWDEYSSINHDRLRRTDRAAGKRRPCRP